MLFQSSETKLCVATTQCKSKRTIQFFPEYATLRPIYAEELPGVAAHDSLFVLLRPGVADPCTSSELPRQCLLPVGISALSHQTSASTTWNCSVKKSVDPVQPPPQRCWTFPLLLTQMRCRHYCGMRVWRRWTNRWPCCPALLNPKTSQSSAWPDVSGWRKTWMAAKHLFLDAVRPSSGYELIQTAKS